MSGDVAYILAVALMVGGAIGVLVSKEALRMTLSFGVFLLGVAACFLYFGMGLLAVSQVFVYVGGVLVLVLFALMIVRRAEGDKVLLGSRFDIGSLATAVAVTLMVVMMLAPEFEGLLPVVGTYSENTPVSTALLGEYLVPFEVAGGLLLVAVLSVLAIVGKEDAR